MATAEITVHLDPRFTRLLERQNNLQAFLLGKFPILMTDNEKAEFIRTQVLAAQAELIEVLNETHWKPWATRPLDESIVPSLAKFTGEMADVFIFFMNLMLVAGVSMTDLCKAVDAKQQINLTRWQNGYDAKASKCPACKRAYNDPDTHCYASAEDSGILAFCAYKERFITREGDAV